MLLIFDYKLQFIIVRFFLYIYYCEYIGYLYVYYSLFWGFGVLYILQLYSIDLCGVYIIFFDNKFEIEMRFVFLVMKFLEFFR